MRLIQSLLQLRKPTKEETELTEGQLCVPRILACYVNWKKNSVPSHLFPEVCKPRLALQELNFQLIQLYRSLWSVNLKWKK